MKKLWYLAAFGGLVLTSCQKKETLNQASTQNNGDHLSKRLDWTKEKCWKYFERYGDCLNYEENCSPQDIIIYGTRPDSWFFQLLQWMIDKENGKVTAANFVAGPVTMTWSSATPGEPIFRTPEYDNFLLSNFADLGITTQEQLNGLDNETFYQVLFPSLSEEQRSMLYSHEYNTIIGLNEKLGKTFIFITPKDKTDLKDAYANLKFVIRFTVRTR